MNTGKMEPNICSASWTSNEVLNNHRELCLKYRGRFSASPNAAAAADFIRETLSGYGLDNSRKDFFPMITWERGKTCLKMSDPVCVEYPCIALPYTSSCNSVFELVDGGMGHPEDLKNVPGGIAGKAVLVDDSNPPNCPGYHRLHKYLFAKNAGASAFVFASRSPGMLAPTGSLAFNHRGDIHQAIPSVGVAMETASELRWWQKKQTVRLHLTMNHLLEKGKDCNVIADLVSHRNPGEMVIVCGHYDGHDISQGAADNASGTAVVLETARLLSPLKDKLNCSVRFVLFGSEEMGLVGSHHLARSMENELQNIRFVFNLDCVGNPGNLAMLLQNCPELTDFYTETSRTFPSDIQISNHFIPFSDHFPFLMRGVPSAFLATKGTGGRGWGHTLADTFEKVSAETLMRISMLTARLVLHTTQTSDWAVIKKSPEQISTMISKAHMKQLLEYENHWIF
jgi:aminopeptidase YwaD